MIPSNCAWRPPLSIMRRPQFEAYILYPSSRFVSVDCVQGRMPEHACLDLHTQHSLRSVHMFQTVLSYAV